MKIIPLVKIFGRKKDRQDTGSSPAPARRKQQEDGFRSYIQRDDLLLVGTETALTVMERKKRRIGILMVLCLIVVGIAGAGRLYLGKRSDEMIKRYTTAGNRISKELENLSKRMGEVQELARIGRGLPLINQYSLLTACLYEALAIRNIQYESSAGALRDVFFIETGRAVDEVEHGGLWTIDAVSLSEDGVQRFVRNVQAQSRQILNMQAYVNYSSGQSRTGTSSSQLVRVIFWR